MKSCETRYAKTPEEIDKIVELNNSLFQEDGGIRDPYINRNWAREYGHHYFTEFIQKEDHHCLIAIADNQIVGYLAGYISERSNIRVVYQATVESIFISKEYRGRGIGTMLVKEFLERVYKSSARLVLVTAYSSNIHAKNFYKKLGFTEYETTFQLLMDDARRARVKDSIPCVYQLFF